MNNKINDDKIKNNTPLSFEKLSFEKFLKIYYPDVLIRLDGCMGWDTEEFLDYYSAWHNMDNAMYKLKSAIQEARAEFRLSLDYRGDALGRRKASYNAWVKNTKVLEKIKAYREMELVLRNNNVVEFLENIASQLEDLRPKTRLEKALTKLEKGN